MAEVTAQSQATQGQASKGRKFEMPKLDVAGLNEYYKQQKQVAAQQPQATTQAAQQEQTSTQSQPAQVQQPTQNDNPDVVTAQEEFKDVKNGDAYTDANGKQWKYEVVDFKVVPEDVKDDIVDSMEEEEGGESDYDENLSRGLDIALAILREEDEGDEEDDTEGEEGATEDSADAIILRACDDVLGVAQDDFSDGLSLTMKRGRPGYITDNPPQYQIDRKKVQSLGDHKFHVEHYGSEANLKARENARRTHRIPVAATWDKCRAKDKSRCRYHGAAFLSDKLAESIKGAGMPVGKCSVLLVNPERQLDETNDKAMNYRMVFSLPDGTSPDVRAKIIKDFVTRNPSIIFDPMDEGLRVENLEDVDDMPIDALTREEINDRLDTKAEASWNERANARGAISWANRDELGDYTYFNMLRERPRNIVECVEDTYRYAKDFPEFLPEGITVEGLREKYDAFMDANEAKKSEQAFIVNGDITDGAEGLVKAAEHGLEKEYKEYRRLAEEFYNLADEVFNSVQKGLQSAFGDIRDEFYDLPTAGEMKDEKFMPYLGQKYKVVGKRMPLGTGEVKDVLQQGREMYLLHREKASKIPERIMEGCETREPLLVMQGIKVMGILLGSAKQDVEDIGKLEDGIIATKQDKWLKKNGVTEKKEEPTVEQEPKAKKKPAVKAKPKKKEADMEAKEEPVVPVPVPPTAPEESNEADTDKSGKQAETRYGSEPEKEVSQSGTGNTEQSKTVNLTPELVQACKEAAKKDKSLRALAKRRIDLFNAFGEDSDQYKEADQKARSAIHEFRKRFYESHGVDVNSLNLPSQPPSAQAQTAQKKSEDKTQATGEEQTSSSATESKKKASKKAAKAAPAAGGGEALKLIKGMEIPDKPTVESATAINKQFSELEGQLRKLTNILQTQSSNSPEWRDAEADMKGIKNEIDSIIKNARGKGYQWTRDNQGTNNRILGLPVNFRIYGIKDDSGKTVNIPYTPPK